jgi:ubiquinone/menaquinone biosynthesis C-methylase UbiE
VSATLNAGTEPWTTAGQEFTRVSSRSVSVAEGYERWAPTYDCSPNPLLAREERYLAPILAGMRKKHVLDLACGTGRWLRKLSANHASLAVGLDCSSSMLRVAKQKEEIVSRLTQADCLALPFAASAFDLMICSFALSHISDLPALARELARVAMPGADVFVSDQHPEAYARGWRTGFRDGDDAIEIESQPRSAEEIVRAFYSGGFECLTHVALCLGDPEREIFVRAGKKDMFEQTCRIPAVFVGHFRSRDWMAVSK